MRTKKVTKMRECIETVYIANDGTEFEDCGDCVFYEDEILRKKLDAIEQSYELEGRANFDGGENMEAHQYKWYRPKNSDEIDLLIQVYGERCHVGECDIGQWVCIEEYDGEGWCTTLEGGIEYARTILSALGYDLVVKKKEELNEN